MDILAQACSSVLNNTPLQSLCKGLYHKNLLLDLLTGELTDKSAFHDMYRSFSGPEHDYYRVLSIKPAAGDHKEDHSASLLVLSSYIEELIPSMYSLYLKSSIVAIAGTSAKNLPEEMEGAIRAFLRENHLNAGISEQFRDLADLRMHYLQADGILALGPKHRPLDCMFAYEDMFIFYFYNRLDGLIKLRDFIMPEIEMLMEHDKVNGTNFFDTLCVYLDKQRNIVEAAEAMFIHRNTMRYRTGRIASLTGIDLENMSDLSRVMFSCSIARYYAQK
jgi:hypothetical protein